MAAGGRQRERAAWGASSWHARRLVGLLVGVHSTTAITPKGAQRCHQAVAHFPAAHNWLNFPLCSSAGHSLQSWERKRKAYRRPRCRGSCRCTMDEGRLEEGAAHAQPTYAHPVTAFFHVAFKVGTRSYSRGKSIRLDHDLVQHEAVHRPLDLGWTPGGLIAHDACIRSRTPSGPKQRQSFLGAEKHTQFNPPPSTSSHCYPVTCDAFAVPLTPKLGYAPPLRRPGRCNYLLHHL